MARAASADFYQGFRYHVISDVGGVDVLQKDVSRETGLNPNAGFQSVTLPELTLEAVEYREGNVKWTMKQPGIPTVSDCTLMRGVTKNDTAFWQWVLLALQGKEYRGNLTILHYHRDEMDDGVSQSVPPPQPFRKLQCYECIPIRFKPAADFDSTASDVSIAEMDIAMEYFKIDTEAFSEEP